MTGASRSAPSIALASPSLTVLHIVDEPRASAILTRSPVRASYAGAVTEERALRPYQLRPQHPSAMLCTSKSSDDRGEDVHVGLKDDIVGNVPTLPPRTEIFDDLRYGSDQYVRACKDVVGAELRPTGRKVFGRAAAMVCHDNALHQRAQLEPCIPIFARCLPHELHPLIDTRHSPP